MKRGYSFLLILFVISYGVSLNASTITIAGPAAGEPGSSDNPLTLSDIIMIPIFTDTALLGFDVVIEIDGPGTLIPPLPDGIIDYGWDPPIWIEPWPNISEPNRIELAGGSFSGVQGPMIAYVELHCDGPGDIDVTISPGVAFGGSFDLNFEEPDIAGQFVVYQIPEPGTIVLLGLGILLASKKKIYNTL